jgi:hypothetical protein
MAIIALKAWYIEQYEPIRELEKRPHDLRLSKNSLLKTGLRADFLEDGEQIKNSRWFQRYLDGETIEFYIQGSGSYAISNIDLTSHEIYFTKQTAIANLEPTIFLSYQTEQEVSGEALRNAVQIALEKLNQRSRLPLKLVLSPRPSDVPFRLSKAQLRKISKSLLFIADSTPIASISGEENLQLIPNPHVCLETGYALHSKRTEQILLVQMELPDLSGVFPFDLPSHQMLLFKNSQELEITLPSVMETMLQRFNLFS